MYTRIYLLLFFLLHISCNSLKTKNQDTSESCSKMRIISEYGKGRSVDGIALENAVEYFEGLTNIKSEYDGSTLGLKTPSGRTIEAWKNWILKNGHDCEY